MKRLLHLICLFLFPFALQAQCTETDEPRVLLVGDSWAFFMNVDGTINKILDRWGHSHYTYYTNTILAENGAETDDFLKPDKQAEIKAQLDAHPSIDVVHLSIGGNDYLGDWNVNYTQEQTDSLGFASFMRLAEIITYIKSLKPGIKIVWSGYAYTNFKEVIEDFAPFQSNHPFYDTWEGMGFPDFTQINHLLKYFSDGFSAYAAADPQVEFVPAMGLMQYTFGQSTPLTVAPYASYPAYTQPLPYGDSTLPSPKNSMRNYGVTKDCFHLSPKGYEDLIDYQFQKFYHKFLMRDTFLLAESGQKSGSVGADGSVYANMLYLGQENGTDIGTVLSFATDQLPTKPIEAASIFLRRKELTGNNPISGTLQLKIKSGNFGSSSNVEAADLTALADATDAPCRFGSNGGNGHWIRLDIPASLLPYLKTNKRTQFLLTSDVAGGKVEFSGTTDPEFAPVLEVKYQSSTGLEQPLAGNQPLVYPNPAKDRIYFAPTHNWQSAELLNVWGETLWQNHNTPFSIPLKGLSRGIYVVRLFDGSKYFVEKVLVE